MTSWCIPSVYSNTLSSGGWGTWAAVAGAGVPRYCKPLHLFVGMYFVSYKSTSSSSSLEMPPVEEAEGSSRYVAALATGTR